MAEIYLEGAADQQDNNRQPEVTSQSLRDDSLGRTPIRFFVEEDLNGCPLLPKVDLQPPQKALKPLREALEAIVDEAKSNPVEFKQASSRADAQLIITSGKLSSNNKALAEISSVGPSKITFNSNVIFDRSLFEATVVHAIERALGLPKRQYSSIPEDPFVR